VDRFRAHSVRVVAEAVPVGVGASEVPSMGIANGQLRVDPAEAVARVAAARRSRLLRVYRRRLRPEDLEDCYSQATLELLARARKTPFASAAHIENAVANYLRAAGAPSDYPRAIFAYNHAEWYVAEVLSWARRYRARYG
jgi:hypothetical protein